MKDRNQESVIVLAIDPNLQLRLQYAPDTRPSQPI
jgi:hypothetical protein